MAKKVRHDHVIDEATPNAFYGQGVRVIYVKDEVWQPDGTSEQFAFYCDLPAAEALLASLTEAVEQARAAQAGKAA